MENLVLNGTGANSTNNTTTPAPSLGAVEKLNVAGRYIYFWMAKSVFSLSMLCVFSVADI